jgi:hypothetical protein
MKEITYDQIEEIKKIKKNLLAIKPELWQYAKEMVELEHWVLEIENDEITLQKIKALFKILEKIDDNSIMIKNENDFFCYKNFLAYMNTIFCFAFVFHSAQKNPGFAGQLLKKCYENKDDPECNIIINRLQVLVQLETYSKLFGIEQRSKVINILKNIFNEQQEQL